VLGARKLSPIHVQRKQQSVLGDILRCFHCSDKQVRARVSGQLWPALSAWVWYINISSKGKKSWRWKWYNRN